MKNIFFAFLSCIFFVLFLVLYIFFSNPDVEKLNGCLTTTMYKVSLCPGSSNYVPLSSISPVLVQTVLISEDASFYFHKGFDWAEIKNSFYTNIERGRFSRGGSTITQQIIKNTLLTTDKTVVRKFKEWVLDQIKHRRSQ